MTVSIDDFIAARIQLERYRLDAGLCAARVLRIDDTQIRTNRLEGGLQAPATIGWQIGAVEVHLLTRWMAGVVIANPLQTVGDFRLLSETEAESGSKIRSIGDPAREPGVDRRRVRQARLHHDRRHSAVFDQPLCEKSSQREELVDIMR